MSIEEKLPLADKNVYVGTLLELTGLLDNYFADVSRSPHKAQNKTDKHDLVTAHDKAVQTLVFDYLRSRFPTSTFLCEEDGIARNKRTGQPRWIVDPIDGTSNFASGLPVWATSVAIDIDGELMAALIHAPLLGETYLADQVSLYRRRRSFLLAGIMESSWERISLEPDGSSFLALSSAPNAGTYARYDDAEGFSRRVKLGVPSLRNFSSAVMELAWTAGGDASAQYNLHTKPWDSAAGLHMVRCSGGDVYTWSCDKDSEFSQEPWYCSGRYLAIGGRCASDDEYAGFLVNEISRLIGEEPEMVMLRTQR